MLTELKQLRRWQAHWLLALAAVYLGLIPLLSGLENVPGVTILLVLSAVACLLAWTARQAHSSSVSLPAPLGLGIDALRGLPPVILWLPAPVSLSWVAATMARVEPAHADYGSAFRLWVAALVLFVSLFLVPLAVENREKLQTLVRAIPWPEVAVVAFITAVAFTIRFIDLAAEPHPFWDDEGEQAIEALQLNQGFKQNLFDMGGGTVQPALYYASMGQSFKLFGTGVLAARLPAAIVGAVTIPILYLMLREMFDRRVALVGTVFLAVLHFHVHFSRIAFPNNYDTFFAVLMLLFAFRALRTKALVDFALTGLVSGLVLYSYQGARVIPMVLIILLAYMALKTWGSFVIKNFWGLAALLSGFVIAALPAALYFQTFPDRFRNRFDSQSIFGTGWLDEQVANTGRSELHIIWDRLQQSFGLLVTYDDVIPHYNAGVPLLDGVSSVLLVIGGVYALFHLFQPRFFALFTLLVLPVVLGSAVLVPPIGSQRFLATAPVTAAFVALGLVLAAEVMVKMVPRLRSYAPAAVGAVLLIIVFMNLSFYFGTYLPSDNFTRGVNRSTAAVADYLDTLDDDYTVYFFRVPGFWVRERSLLFRARDKILVDVAEQGEVDTFVETRGLPGQQPAAAAARMSRSNALFLVPTDRSAELAVIEQLCPGGKESDPQFAGSAGQIGYVWYEVLDALGCIGGLHGPVLQPLEG